MRHHQQTAPAGRGLVICVIPPGQRDLQTSLQQRRDIGGSVRSCRNRAAHRRRSGVTGSVVGHHAVAVDGRPGCWIDEGGHIGQGRADDCVGSRPAVVEDGRALDAVADLIVRPAPGEGIRCDGVPSVQLRVRISAPNVTTGGMASVRLTATDTGRIMSISSWLRMWQCQTYSQPKLTSWLVIGGRSGCPGRPCC